MLNERDIAQAVALLRGLVRIKRMDPPLSVAMVVGTSAESGAWRKEAIEYLTAKAEGVEYIPSTVDLGGGL